jgi:large subunit ribosomal protein L23
VLQLQAQNKYTFKVAMGSHKIDVRRAVETIFKVKVVSVNMIICLGRSK